MAAYLGVSAFSHTDKATYLALFHPHLTQKTQQNRNKTDILCPKMTSYPPVCNLSGLSGVGKTVFLFRRDFSAVAFPGLITRGTLPEKAR